MPTLLALRYAELMQAYLLLVEDSRRARASGEIEIADEASAKAAQAWQGIQRVAYEARQVLQA
jgi:hypothetical protein